MQISHLRKNRRSLYPHHSIIHSGQWSLRYHILQFLQDLTWPFLFLSCPVTFTTHAQDIWHIQNACWDTYLKHCHTDYIYRFVLERTYRTFTGLVYYEPCLLSLTPCDYYSIGRSVLLFLNCVPSLPRMIYCGFSYVCHCFYRTNFRMLLYFALLWSKVSVVPVLFSIVLVSFHYG